MARKLGPGKRFEARLKKICMKALLGMGMIPTGGRGIVEVLGM